MTSYEFTLVLSGSLELTEDIADALFETDCDDGMPGTCDRVFSKGNFYGNKENVSFILLRCQIHFCPQLYTIEIFLMGDPLGGEFEGQVISRKIQIRGKETLHDLHYTIFEAFDRWEEHVYEFNPGASPDDQSRLYISSGGIAQLEYSCGAPEDTTFDSLGLKEEQHFGYTFDMGDNREHELEVSTIELAPVKGKYPKIMAKVGASPPQYPDFEEEDE